MKKALFLVVLSFVSLCANAQRTYGDATNGITVSYKRGASITIKGHGDLSKVFGTNESYTFTYFGASCIKKGGVNVSQGDVWTSDNSYTYNNNEISFTDMCELAGWGTYALAQTPGSKDIWHEVIYDLDKYGKTVIIESEGEELATINTNIVRSLLNLPMRSLDLSGVYIDNIVSPGKTGSANENGTFMTAPGWAGRTKPNKTLETLYTPQVKYGCVLTEGTIADLPNLRYLYISDGVTELAENAISGRKNENRLSHIKFPNTLEIIRKGACDFHNDKNNEYSLKDLDGNTIPYIRTLVFPASLKVIESGAFTQTCPKDVYFLGLEAPKVAKHAWGDDAYISNNTVQLQAVGVGAGDEKVTAYFGEGYATRDNYKTKNGYMCMLHYPAECTPAQAAKYTDPIRDYKRIDWNFQKLLEENENSGDASNRYIHYNPGLETTPLVGSVDGDGTRKGNFVIPSSFKQEYEPVLSWNLETRRNEPVMIEDENGNLKYDFSNYNKDASGNNGYDFSKGFYGGDYDGAYYDIALGDQYTWPSMGMAQRATIVAQNGVTWDGVTTIGDQIRARLQEGETYEGDGSEYIGLHQFVFTSGESIGGGDTQEWPLDKYADGKWHSICVPFDMTKRQMKETFGKKEVDEDGNAVYDIRLCMFSGVIRNKNNVTLQFNDEQFDKPGIKDDDVVLKAHVSYMIWADKNREFTGNAETTFKKYVIKAGDPIVTKINSTSEDDTESIEYRFVGNYKKYYEVENDQVAAKELKAVAIPQYSYYFSFSRQAYRFMTGDKTSPWNPYAAVVLLPEGQKDKNAYFVTTTASRAKVMTSIMDEIEEDEEETTAVEEVTIEINNDVIYTNSDVYNLKGQKVGNSLEGLEKGIYIVNGKKYMVK